MKRHKPKPGGVSVGFLHPGHYAHCFAESLQDLILSDLSGPQRTAHDFGKLGKECASGAIVAGRNQLAKIMCDQSPAEWLFMVDSDMGFAPDTLERLLAVADPKDKPIVGGLCFAHKTDGRASFYGTRYRACPTLYTFYEDDERVGFVPMLDYPVEQVVPVAATGGACVLIHRSVFERIRDKYGDVWFDTITHPKGQTVFSEDLSFCVRAAGVGVPIFVDTRIKTTHDKGGVFLDEEFYRRQVAA